MKNLKKLAVYFSAIIFAITTISSCSKDENKKEIDTTLQEISFHINDPSNWMGKKLNNLELLTETVLPECSDEPAKYVKIKISGGSFNEPQEYELDLLQGLNNGSETVPLKLAAANDYKIEELLVIGENNDTIWVSPKKGSKFQIMFNLNNTVNKSFEVEEFKKMKINIDVMCWASSAYKFYGFSWMDFKKVKINELCFYGGICVDDHYSWHMKGSPYYGQIATEAYTGYDFPAIFKVKLYRNGILKYEKSNEGIYTKDTPLCLEYADITNQEDDYYYEILLLMPDRSLKLIEKRNFTGEKGPNNLSESGLIEFVYGDCNIF